MKRTAMNAPSHLILPPTELPLKIKNTFTLKMEMPLLTESELPMTKIPVTKNLSIEGMISL